MRETLTVIFALLTLLSVSLQRTYSRVPLKELKRRAREDDDWARLIMSAVGYGHSLRAVLWFLIVLSSAGFFVMVTRTAPLWFALTACVSLVWLGFVVIPAARVTVIGEKLAKWCAPPLAKLLSLIHPVLDKIVQFARKLRPLHLHSGLYDRQDLLDLLASQLVQPDNRIEKVELEIARHALTFGDDSISEHMVPRRVVVAAKAEEPIGPIVMDELHNSGHSRFPVYDNKKDNIVGTLYLRDLVRSDHGGKVRDLTKADVFYIHEDQSLQDALQAILKTHHQLFIVVNSFEEYVGIITIEDVLEAIIGQPIIDEFDQYDDLRAVATRTAKKEHSEHQAHEPVQHAPLSSELEPSKIAHEATSPEDTLELDS